MDIDKLVVVLLVGAVAGWLAGTIMKGKGFGIIGNIIIGVIGAVLGDYLFNFLGISVSGLVGSLITATAGAVVLLFALTLVKKLK